MCLSVGLGGDCGCRGCLHCRGAVAPPGPQSASCQYQGLEARHLPRTEAAATRPTGPGPSVGGQQPEANLCAWIDTDRCTLAYVRGCGRRLASVVRSLLAATRTSRQPATCATCAEGFRRLSPSPPSPPSPIVIVASASTDDRHRDRQQPTTQVPPPKQPPPLPLPLAPSITIHRRLVLFGGSFFSLLFFFSFRFLSLFPSLPFRSHPIHPIPFCSLSFSSACRQDPVLACFGRDFGNGPSTTPAGQALLSAVSGCLRASALSGRTPLGMGRLMSCIGDGQSPRGSGH